MAAVRKMFAAGVPMKRFRRVACACAACAAACAAAATFEVRQIARADGPLEPSLRNEVEHALGRAERWLAARPPSAMPPQSAADLFGTNGLAAADIAIKLISSQKGGGWWITPTNSAPTRIAVEILKGL